MGITQAQLAETIATKKQRISEIEGGNMTNDCDRIIAIARALETTPDYLFGFTEKEADVTITDQPELDKYDELYNLLTPREQALYKALAAEMNYKYANILGVLGHIMTQEKEREKVQGQAERQKTLIEQLEKSIAILKQA